MASSRVDWAVLLHRTHGLDALACPRCGGRMRAMAILVEPAVVKKILATRACPPSRCPEQGHAIRPGRRATTSTPRRPSVRERRATRDGEVRPAAKHALSLAHPLHGRGIPAWDALLDTAQREAGGLGERPG